MALDNVRATLRCPVTNDRTRRTPALLYGSGPLPINILIKTVHEPIFQAKSRVALAGNMQEC